MVGKADIYRNECRNATGPGKRKCVFF